MGILGTLANPKALIPIVIGGLLFGFFLRRSYQVGIGPASSEIGVAVGNFGQSLRYVGSGVKELGTGVGAGISGLFSPLFTLRDLVFPPEAGNQPAPTAATQGQIPPETPPIATTQEGAFAVLDSLAKDKGFGQVSRKGVFSNQFTVQDLGFAVSKRGTINTGVRGLGQKTLEAQARLSRQYGIPTFDTKGAISTFGGYVAQNPFGVKSLR